MRTRRGLLTRWEIAVGVLLVLGTAAVLRPRIERATWRTRRAEAEVVLESLAEHQTALRASTGTPVALDPFPRGPAAVGRDAVGWGDLGPPGWTPPLPVARCSYATDGLAPLRLVATCDVDGDGLPARVALTPGQDAVRLTPEDVY